MPARDLFDQFDRHMKVDAMGLERRDYGRTARAWLDNQDANRAAIMPIMAQVYGTSDAGNGSSGGGSSLWRLRNCLLMGMVPSGLCPHRLVKR